jgi:hypothetical protein
MRKVTLGALCLLTLAVAVPARAQQPFSFVVATPDRSHPAADSGALALFAGKALDPLTGIQTTRGRVTLVGLEDVRFDQRDVRHAHQAEFLVDLFGASSSLKVAAGSGVRRESGGTNVLLTRVVVEAPAFAGRVVGNVMLEKPLAVDRDAVDMITTVAYTRPVSRTVWVGVETLLEDIEGFWDPAEADGGARLFVGPSVDIGQPSLGWGLHVTGGREIRATQSTVSSDASRLLGRPGFVFRIAASHRF